MKRTTTARATGLMAVAARPCANGHGITWRKPVMQHTYGFATLSASRRLRTLTT